MSKPNREAELAWLQEMLNEEEMEQFLDDNYDAFEYSSDPDLDIKIKYKDEGLRL